MIYAGSLGSAQEPETRIGQNGKAAFRDPDPSPAQQAVIDVNKAAIRKAVKKIGRWLVFQKQKK